MAKFGARYHDDDTSGRFAGVQWILNPEGCAARAALRRSLLGANVDMVVAVESYNYDLQLALVAQGRGLSLVPERILTRSRFSGRLQNPPRSWVGFSLDRLDGPARTLHWMCTRYCGTVPCFGGTALTAHASSIST
jgi:DNA-binding transcriptional LysR family regulator